MAFQSREDRKFKGGSFTKVMVPEEINLLVSSNPNAGARLVSADGSAFSVQLQDGIKIPSDAKNVNVSVEEATIWWVVPNIITGVNDRIYITAPRALDDALTAYNIQVPQGLYDLTALNDTVLRELENAGAKVNPDPVINILADDATQKVEFRFNYVGTEIDFTQPDTFRGILGYNSAVLGPNAAAPFIYLAPNVAAFNTVNSFLIHSDLVTKGLSLNGNFNQTVAQVLINVRPGSQIVSTPFNPAKSEAQELAGAIRTTLRFFLTDDQDRPVNTNGEYWTARIKISYLHPHYI